MCSEPHFMRPCLEVKTGKGWDVARARIEFRKPGFKSQCCKHKTLWRAFQRPALGNLRLSAFTWKSTEFYWNWFFCLFDIWNCFLLCSPGRLWSQDNSALAPQVLELLVWATMSSLKSVFETEDSLRLNAISQCCWSASSPESPCHMHPIERVCCVN